MIAEEAEPRPGRALVAIPPRPVEPAGLHLGTVFYLISLGLVAAATLSASLGIGFYLLVHPQQEAAAEPARSSDADMKLRTSDESAAASQPEFASTASEASAPIPSVPLSANALPVRPPSSREVEGLSNKAGPGALGSEERGAKDSLSSLQELDHLAVRNASLHGQVGEPAGGPSNSAEVINGIVTDVRDVTTWTLGGRTVRLFGINPGPPKFLASLVNWVRAKGPVECMPQARTLLYRCFTATGEDIAEAALLAGVGRAGNRATAAYENAESSARRMGKGLWARRWNQDLQSAHRSAHRRGERPSRRAPYWFW
jgi:endonuclease YncB( thermonuclease family)